MYRRSLCLLVSVLVLGFAATVAGQAPYQQGTDPDGLVVIETENFDENITRDDPHFWEFNDDTAGFVGTGFMRCMPDSGTNFNPPDQYLAGPELVYYVNFTRTGTHYVWARGLTTGGNDDSFHVGIDGDATTSDRMQPPGTRNEWVWAFDRRDSQGKAFIEVDTPGVHAISLYMREDGYRCDRILLTTSDAYTPDGEGPPESMRQPPTNAAAPSPGDGADDVIRDLILNWEPGQFAAAHDVYLGTAFDDVNNADRSNALDVLVSQGQADTAFDAGRLEFGVTYYWRVDEVNGAPDNTIFKGDVWSFTIEPFAYTIENVVATTDATSAPDEGIENIVNGSGLNDQDQHSIEGSDMWLGNPAGADPITIQFEFDRVYKMHQMRVWNYNVMFELMLNFGLKDVTVEYSENGADWTLLGDVVFNQATAMEGYEANTTVDFGGVPAKFVRFTVNANFGMLPQFGLSEVRFSFIAAHAREPQPEDGATGLGVDTVLGWRAGREADMHDVYLAAGSDGLALVESVATNSYAPADLQFGTTYSWRIDEVNEAEAINVWESDVWTFSTLEYAVIDDMESYDDDENAIFDTWLDGFVNETGATVGYFESPFAETTIVNSGSQSMPLEYANDAAPFYSEAELDLGGLDIDTNGADTLRLFFAGQAPGFLETADATILMNAIGNDIWNDADQFRYAYRTLTGDGEMTVRVDAIDGSPNGWVKGGVMIRQSTEPGSVNAFTAVTGGSGDGATFQWRAEADASSDSSRTLTGIAPPYYARIVREGNTFTGYLSADGINWEQQGDSSVDVAMTDPVLIGIALTSHNVNQATSAQFSDISITGNVSDTWELAEIGAEQPTTGNDLALLYVALEDTSGNVAVVTHPDAAAVAKPTWTEWLIPYSDLVGVNLNRLAVMYVGVGDRDNPTADGTGLVFIDDIGYGSPTPPPAPVNILANGGFEDGVVDPWNTYGDAGVEVVSELVGAAVPAGPVEGDMCLHVTVNSAGANFWDAGLQHAGHVFEAGKSYKLSAYLKAKEGTMDINFKPELGANPWTGYGSQAFTMTDSWQEFSVSTGVIPEDVDPATITFHIAYAAGEFWVDDVRFMEE